MKLKLVLASLISFSIINCSESLGSSGIQPDQDLNSSIQNIKEPLNKLAHPTLYSIKYGIDSTQNAVMLLRDLVILTHSRGIINEDHAQKLAFLADVYVRETDEFKKIMKEYVEIDGKFVHKSESPATDKD
jgi:hypothetical protein